MFVAIYDPYTTARHRRKSVPGSKFVGPNGKKRSQQYSHFRIKAVRFLALLGTAGQHIPPLVSN